MRFAFITSPISRNTKAELPFFRHRPPASPDTITHVFFSPISFFVLGLFDQNLRQWSYIKMGWKIEAYFSFSINPTPLNLLYLTVHCSSIQSDL
jgi:hypothetical protein